MELDSADLALLGASWAPVRRDPAAAGLQLFKGLFTKFPEYLRFFPQFADLELESMRHNARLIRHAVKVIETVTFVVDSAGREAQAAKLAAALESLVRGHLKRNIGLKEFRNLGTVLIDFVCDFNEPPERRLEPGALVAAWTKLYGAVLQLVEREELAAAAASAGPSAEAPGGP